MKRREFLGSCAAVSGAVTLQSLADAWADAPPRMYGRTRLIDIHGQPILASKLATETNYVFHYPYESTPCFLLKLPRRATESKVLKREDGSSYAWSGGVGAQRSIVAFSAICAHKLAYPTREVSFIRYQKDRSSTSGAAVIHCCADHSVYDPAQGARVVSGPAPQPLAAILLDWDATTDEIAATGTLSGDMFKEFFQKYAFRLQRGPRAREKETVQGGCVVQALENYCNQQVKC